jgi:hypothetical protein
MDGNRQLEAQNMSVAHIDIHDYSGPLLRDANTAVLGVLTRIAQSCRLGLALVAGIALLPVAVILAVYVWLLAPSHKRRLSTQLIALEHIREILPLMDFKMLAILRMQSGEALSKNTKLLAQMQDVVKGLPRHFPERIAAVLHLQHKVCAQREQIRVTLELLEAISKGHSAMRALPHEQSAKAYALLRERMKLLEGAPKNPQEDLWILDSEPTFLKHA